MGDSTYRPSAPFPTKPRRHHSRSRSGCLTCRQRRKKCDEGKPRCTGCIRNKLECNWPETPDLSPANSDSPESGCELVKCDSPSSLISESSDQLLAPADDMTVIPWSDSLRSFTGPTRAALLTPSSALFLSHFLVETGCLMSNVPIKNNPFMTSVLPLAYVDDLLMHTIMALSGAHLSCYDEGEKPEIRTAIAQHYTCIVRSLRVALQNLSPKDTGKILRILITLIMLAFFESLSSTCLNGGMFPHLRASRQLILWLLEEPNQPTAADDRFLFGFILELYAYLLLVNTLGPFGALESRVIPIDPFVESLTSLSTYDSFGILFVGCHRLFELIPRVAHFATLRLGEGVVVSPRSQALYKDLGLQIANWRREDTPWWGSEEDGDLDAIAEVYRHGMAIYLESAMAGASLAQNAAACSKIQADIDGMSNRIFEKDLPSGRYATLLLWPLMVAGSCLRRDEHRRLLSSGLREAKCRTWNSIRGSELLELMWKAKDGRIFGPHGLYITMERYGLNYCVS